MKNILVIVGSGLKNCNTDKLADAFIKGASEAGHSVTKMFLGDKTINGCIGCNACRWGKPCVQKDGMQDIYPLYAKSDMVVLASPLYFWTISARLKAFLERLYAVAEEDDNPPKGRYEKHAEKDCALLMTAADDLFWTFEQAVSYYRFNCVNYLGWHDKGMVLVGGCGGSPTKRCIEETGRLKEAYSFGKRLDLE
ncbi:flavodoxin family protein [Synergistaceae bacterium OttesenSCG-928-I11]|nr:flavodoxin family protein [Synergistaceae bacterium OttesenSCG-928-I11]